MVHASVTAGGGIRLRTINTAWTIGAFCLAQALLTAQVRTSPGDAPRPKHILILYSAQAGLPGYERANEGLWPVLRSAGIPTDNVFAEYLDLVRNPSPDYRARLADFLRQKYAGREIGVIVAISTGAASLVLDEQYRLFEGIPVIAALPLLNAFVTPRNIHWSFWGPITT